MDHNNILLKNMLTSLVTYNSLVSSAYIEVIHNIKYRFCHYKELLIQQQHGIYCRLLCYDIGYFIYVGWYVLVHIKTNIQCYLILWKWYGLSKVRFIMISDSYFSIMVLYYSFNYYDFIEVVSNITCKIIQVRKLCNVKRI